MPTLKRLIANTRASKLNNNLIQARIRESSMNSGQLTVYRGCTPIIDAEYNPESDDSPSAVIIDALAKAARKDPLELPSLYEFVNAEALDRLFADHSGAADAHTLLSFKVEKWNVFVRADGRIRVCDATQQTDPKPVFDTNTA